MKEKIKSLRDTFKVALQEDIANLTDAEKIAFCDSATTGDAPKGIIVTLELSAAAKVINNRVYPPKGQRDYVDSWTVPFGKPLLVQHDESGDPLGRITSVEYVDNSQEAMKFFKSIKDFQAFKDDVESDNPKRIYNAIVKNNFVGNKNWPGIGRLIAKVRVNNRDAIEKFLDQRYLTVSAGTASDRYVCGVCNSNWASGEVCDHQPGTITDDGKPVLMITGAFVGKELSTANNPANKTSMVMSIQLDAEDDSPAYQDFQVDESMIYSVDSQTEIEMPPVVLEPAAMLRDAMKTGDYTAIRDAINGKTFSEMKILVSIHDSLHGCWDWEIGYSDSTISRIPKDIFALHAELHDMAVTSGWRDALMNGALDEYSSVGEPTGEFKYASSDAEVTAETPVAEVLKDAEPVSWYLLNNALLVEVADAKIDTADLANEFFADPNKTFPIANQAYIDAANRVLAQVEIPESQKALIQTAIDAQVQNLKSQPVVDSRLADLQKDYENALAMIVQLQSEIEKIKNSSTILDTDENTSNHSSDLSTLELPKVIENPSIIHSEVNTKKAEVNLGDFEKRIVQRFLDIKTKHGDNSATTFIRRKKAAGYLPPTFNINQYIQSESD